MTTLSQTCKIPVQRGPTPVDDLESTSEWTRRYTRRILIFDIAAAVLGCSVAFLVRFHNILGLSVPYAYLTAVLPVAWVATAWFCRAYEPRFLGVGPEEFRRVVTAAFVLTGAIAVGSYATKAEVARGYTAMAIALTALLALTGRHVARQWLYRQRRAGRCRHRVLLVGHEQGVQHWLTAMRRATHAGMEVVGVCLPDGLQTADLVRRGVTVVGDFTTVAKAAELTEADTVAVLACPEMDGPALRRLGWDLETTGSDLLVAPGALDVAGPRVHIRPVSGMPLLHVEAPEFTGARRALKTSFDRVVAAVVLLSVASVLVVVALAVRLTSPGPVFFRQRRVGLHGREFTMLKFRTMVEDAEDRKPALSRHNESEGGVLFKMRNDPRVTRVGTWLRRYSLDELPQLLNVLTGSMSLVGPRPPLASEVVRYDEDMRTRRMLVKPGITGLWQISGRSDLPWDEAARLDLRYVENWSLCLDFSILARTVAAVVRGSGAY